MTPPALRATSPRKSVGRKWLRQHTDDASARIEYVEAVTSRPLIVTGDDAIAYGVSPRLGVSPSLPGSGLRHEWPDPLRALLGEMKWADTRLTNRDAGRQRDGKPIPDEQRRDQCSRGKHSDCLLHDSISCVE